MENKEKHIDQFLEEKFRHFESEPDVNAFNRIEAVMEHLNHPIDQALNIKLAEFNTEPSAEISQNLIDNPQIFEHPIDHLLNEKLTMLEDQPNSDFSNFDQIKNKKRRRVFFFYLSSLTLLLSVLTTFYFHNQSNTIPISNKTNIVESKGNQSKFSNPQLDLKSNHQSIKDVAISEEKKDIHISNIKKTIESENETEQLNLNGNASSFDQVSVLRNAESNENGLISEDIIHTALYPLGLQEFRSNLKFKTNEKIAFNRPKKLFAYSPIYFHLSIGLSIENNSNNSTESENLHKDAIDLFEKGNGKNKTGMSLTIGTGYQITKRIDVKIGFKYSEHSTSQNLNYVYTDIPVYDTTGKLKGYIYRSPSNSPRINHTVKSKSTYLSAPIQINFGLFQTRLLKLSLGVGMEYNFTQSSKGEFFNFNSSKMEFFESKSKSNLIPGLSINGLYRIRSGIQLNAVLGFQRMKLNQTIGGIEMRSTYGIPSMTLGLIYTPILKL